MSRWDGLIAALPGRLRLEEPLARHSSFKIGGPAEAWAEVQNERELALCLEVARELEAPVTLLAGGTNVLVSDQGLRGLVISLDGSFKDWAAEGGLVRAGAGMNLALLARKTALAGQQGLEWAVGIPGSVGGGLVMNAGAHGGELKDVVKRVGLLLNGKPEVWDAEKCGFQYRHSAFKALGSAAILLWCEMLLKAGDAAALKETMETALAKRKATQPLELPNAGSVFKNPPGDSAGRLIEACGLKGRTLGGAQISEKHANFVVNLGGASARDVRGLMQTARREVKERFGVELVDEILMLGAMT